MVLWYKDLKMIIFQYVARLPTTSKSLSLWSLKSKSGLRTIVTVNFFLAWETQKILETFYYIYLKIKKIKFITYCHLYITTNSNSLSIFWVKSKNLKSNEFFVGMIFKKIENIMKMSTEQRQISTFSSILLNISKCNSAQKILRSHTIRSHYNWFSLH